MQLEKGFLPKGSDREEAIKEMLKRQKDISEKFKDTSDWGTMVKNLASFAENTEVLMDLDHKFGFLCGLLGEPRDRWSIIGREVVLDGGTTEGYVALHLATDARSDRTEGFLHLFNAVRRHRVVLHLRSNDMLKFQLVEVKSFDIVRSLSGNPQEYKKEL